LRPHSVAGNRTYRTEAPPDCNLDGALRRRPKKLVIDREVWNISITGCFHLIIRQAGDDPANDDESVEQFNSIATGESLVLDFAKRLCSPRCRVASPSLSA
jgi:hypothetical protein